MSFGSTIRAGCVIFNHAVCGFALRLVDYSKVVLTWIHFDRGKSIQNSNQRRTVPFIVKSRKHHMQVKVPFLHDWLRVLGQIPDQGWLWLVDVLWQWQDYNVPQSATCPLLRLLWDWGISSSLGIDLEPVENHLTTKSCTSWWMSIAYPAICNRFLAFALVG